MEIISNSLLTKAYIKFDMPGGTRPHHFVSLEHTKFGTFGSITKRRFDSD